MGNSDRAHPGGRRSTRKTLPKCLAILSTML